MISPDPLDTILWLHIGGMIASFGMLRTRDSSKKACIFMGGLGLGGRLTMCRNNISDWNGTCVQRDLMRNWVCWVLGAWGLIFLVCVVNYRF